MKRIDQLSEDEFSRLLRRAVALPDAPPALLRATIDQWQPPRPSALESAAQGVLRRITAALTFDSWAAGTLAFGVRSMPSDTRHLLYSAMGRDIDVRITPSASHFLLTGQILGPDESGAVELASAAGADDSAGAKVTTLDAMGEFRLEGIPEGSYVLTLRLGDDEIVLPPIDLGERRR